MPRTHFTPRKEGMRPIICVIIFFVIAFLLLSPPRSRKKRCTPASTESYCPQPMQCTDRSLPTNDDATPRPLVVIAAGGSRAASTFLYNALRILLRIRDPNTVSGWYVDLLHLYDSYAQVMPRNDSVVRDVSKGNRVQAFQSVGSVLIKIHTVRDWHQFLGGGDIEPTMEDVVDAVYTSHRDIRDTVRSIRDMGWGVSYTASQMAEKDFCRRMRRKRRRLQYFRREDYAREDTWVTVARTQILCREALIETAGSKLKLDVKAEDVVGMEDRETIALLREMARGLDYSYSDAELELAVKELKRLRPSKCDHGFNVEMSLNPVTHLHKGHIHEGDAEEAKNGMEAIGRDPVCQRWLEQQLYDVQH